MAKDTKKKASSISVELNTKETKDFLRHIITNNRHLQNHHKPMVSVEVEGESGIGKTSVMLQIAEEQNLHMVKLNLAQIEELGDLVGFPIRQFEVISGTDESTKQYIDEFALDQYRSLGYHATGGNRMSYCPPEWIAGKEKGGILLLDDWNRADVRFIQAVMELIDRQQYISWKLPKDWHIILTSNPDNGEYMVQSIDSAQRTRFVSIKMKYDVDCWAEWAEQNEVDGRCINFMIKHPEVITKGNVNSRSAVTFFNAISSLDNFEASLPLIQMIGEGSVGSDFASLFTTFIQNKLDRMISPKEILEGDEIKVLNTLKGLVGNGDKYRADIASVLATRLINYTIYRSEKENTPAQVIDSVITRISKIVTEQIFTTDLCYQIVKQIYSSNTKKFNKMASNQALIKYVLK